MNTIYLLSGEYCQIMKFFPSQDEIDANPEIDTTILSKYDHFHCLKQKWEKGNDLVFRLDIHKLNQINYIGIKSVPK